MSTAFAGAICKGVIYMDLHKKILWLSTISAVKIAKNVACSPIVLR